MDIIAQIWLAGFAIAGLIAFGVYMHYNPEVPLSKAEQIRQQYGSPVPKIERMKVRGRVAA